MAVDLAAVVAVAVVVATLAIVVAPFVFVLDLVPLVLAAAFFSLGGRPLRFLTGAALFSTPAVEFFRVFLAAAFFAGGAAGVSVVEVVVPLAVESPVVDTTVFTFACLPLPRFFTGADFLFCTGVLAVAVVFFGDAFAPFLAGADSAVFVFVPVVVDVDSSIVGSFEGVASDDAVDDCCFFVVSAVSSLDWVVSFNDSVSCTLPGADGLGVAA